MTFDPYHKWLGIPTDRRPITYYDLLGLQFGERDPFAIRSAIEQRRAFVSQQRGQGQDQYVQKLLAQIEKATTTLLSEEMKFRYDQENAHLKPDQSKSKRRRSYVIPRVVETRIERIYGEGSGIVGDLFGIVAIIFGAFALMAIFSFTLRNYHASKGDSDPKALTWLEQRSMDSKSKNDGTDDASLTSKVGELQGKITKWRENETKLKILNQSMERDRLKLLGQLDSLSSNNNPDEVEKKKAKLLQDELKDILRKSAAYKTKCSDYELAILKSSSTLRSIERQMAAQDAGVTDAELTQLTRTMLELDESLAKQDVGMEVVDTVNDTITKQLADYRTAKEKSGPLTAGISEGLGGTSSRPAEPIDVVESPSQGTAISIYSPDATRLLELDVGKPRLYDSNPLRIIEGRKVELKGWQFTSIPQRTNNSYEIIANKPTTIYAFGGGKKFTAADFFGTDAAKWENATGDITGINVNVCVRRELRSGETLRLSGFELQICAESMVLSKPLQPASTTKEPIQTKLSNDEGLGGVSSQAESKSLEQNENLIGATLFRGHRYKVFHEAGLDWMTAKSRCAAMGGHLVTISDEQENKFMIALATKTIGDINNSGIWLGATDERNEGKWEWLDETPFRYTNWYGAQPNGKEKENYLLLLLSLRTAQGNEIRGWCDQPRGGNVHVIYYACEWDSIENPSKR